MEWSEKIRCIEEELNIQNERGRLAGLLGIRPGIISDIKSGKSKNPGSDITLLLINKLGVSPEWLDKELPPVFIDSNKLKKQLLPENFFHEKAEKTASPPLPDTPGEVEPTRQRPQETAAQGENALRQAARRRMPVIVDGGAEEGLLIPVMAQGLSAGIGFDYEDGEIIRYIKVPAWIARSGRDLVALPVYGDSMEPTVSGGDLVVCDSGGFCGDGLYMLRDEDRGLTFCKRVIWTPGGWTIKSDNPTYEPMKVEDRAIQIVARILAAVKEIK